MPTDSQIQERKEVTAQIMAVEWSPCVAERRIAKQCGISRRAARRYIRAHRKAWRVLATQDPAAVRDDLLIKLEGLWHLSLGRTRAGEDGESVPDPDYKTAAGIAVRMAELRGLDPEAVRELRRLQREDPAKVIDVTPDYEGARLRLMEGGGGGQNGATG